MSNFNVFIESVATWQSMISRNWASFALLMFFVLLSIAETYFPKRDVTAKRWRLSYGTNISLFLFNSTVLSLLSVSSLLLLAERYAGRGLIAAISNPAEKALIAFLAFDLTLYIWHRVIHRFECLWMFHKVHHSDPHVNVSTAFRIHVLELLFTNAIKAVYIITLGVDKTVVLVNETLMTFFIMFHHSNMSFPGERLLGRIFVVPSLHRVHHSLCRNEHDRNYGAVFSIWDRLFGTLEELEPAAVGIKNNPPQDFIGLVKFGFKRRVTTSSPTIPSGLSVQQMIAEAAYYKAKNRGFCPGYDLCDWLEAEREIIKQVYANRPARAMRQHPVSKRLTGARC